MKSSSPILDSCHFEVRYAYGHLYFDRCGQCLNDIERNCEGWIVKTADPSQGILECPSKSLSISFNNERFAFSSHKSSRAGIKTIAQEVNNTWKIIEANLGLEEYLRQGFRLYYLIATLSEEESEHLMEKAEFKIVLPGRLISSGFKIKNRSITSVLTKGNYEYRLQMMGATRHEAMNPDNLIKADPKLLSKKQNEVRMAKLKQLSEYNANPMYGLFLDVDCYQIKPERISAEDFIINQTEIVQTEFLPTMEKL